MLHIKKTLILTILFLVGFVVGVITMEILSWPARRAYRETLQRNFVRSQESLAYKALKEGNDLRAMVHLWTVMEAGPDGSELFNDPVTTEMDKTFFFLSPVINNTIKNVSRKTPEEEEALKSLCHGELAVVLEQLGYKEVAREHYLIASRLLNIPENKARKLYQAGMKNRKTQE